MTVDLPEIEQRIDQAAAELQPRLRLELRKARRRLKEGKPADRILQRIDTLLSGRGEAAPGSSPDAVPVPRHAPDDARLARRSANLPKVTFPQDLPVVARRDVIAEAIANHPVVIVCGDTGSGKSTQLPKICLELGRGVRGFIGHTQPRRIAARSLASRIAEELGAPLGQDVGYKVRFTDTTRPESYVKLMTDGILLAEMQRDRLLRQYDTLIIDEAHERSLNIDFLLGYLKQLMPRRPELKLIITSATIDPQRFAEHFADPRGEPAPIVEVSGRTYPVEVRYRPVEGEADDPEPADLPGAIREALVELHGGGGVDTLVFLPTERDILETARALRDLQQRGLEVLPLYARLSPKEQQRIFQTGKGRRVVLATNVAETSLTVPGITSVIDTGLARVSRYSARAGVQRLPIEPISQASADQRKGRCGRVAPGICIRLYSEDAYEGRDRFTQPEIQRSNLASVILQMQAMGLGGVEQFPFIDPPKHSAIRDGYDTLRELGAIDDEHTLTDIGRKLAKLPLDPRIGRMILAAQDEGCVSDLVPIAAALSAGDPRIRPAEAAGAADAAHKQLADERSDFLTLLKLWDFVHRQSRKLSRSQFRKACQQNYLSHTRVREWMDIDRQLREMAGETKLRLGSRRISFEDGEPGDAKTRSTAEQAIHRALLAGLITNVAMKADAVSYTGTGGKKLYLWPGSVLFETKPGWIMSAEQVETTRLYARTDGPINPSWIEKLAPHLLSRSFSEPHYHAPSGHVQAFEKVSLGGLVIVPRRSVHYGRIDPAVSRELFIHHALVEGEYNRRAAFFEHNTALREQVEKLEAKTRRRDLLADVEARYAFYDQRIPPEINNVPAFEQWRKQAEREHPKLLFMTEDDLLAQPVDAPAHAYPDQLKAGAMHLPLEYRLEPGAKADGVTVVVPVEAVNQLDGSRLDWVVPGLLEEKVTAMIRSLPKALRKNFVPAPDWARDATARLDREQPSLSGALAKALTGMSGVTVPPDAFDARQIPEHLRMNVRAVDAKGEAVAESRSIDDVRQAAGGEAAASLQADDTRAWHRDGITGWDVGELPPSVEVVRGGVTLKAFPALVDQGDTAGLRLFDAPDTAAVAHRGGVRRLMAIALHDAVQHQVSRLANLQSIVLQASTLMKKEALRRELADLVIDRACLGDDAEPIRDPMTFADRLEAGWNKLGPTAAQVGKLIGEIFTQHHQATLALDQAATNPTWQGPIHDMRQQLAELITPGFLGHTPYPWLAQYPRYLAGIVARIRKLQQGKLDRDEQTRRQFNPWWQLYHDGRAAHAQRRIDDPQLAHFRWMLEEYRVSLFAQELGTAIAVSTKRLEQQWKNVRR